MDELFGISMDHIMRVLLSLFSLAILLVFALMLLNRIIAKLGLRNIPRRWAQTILIVIGVMLSTVIMSAALSMGDTISFSIRNAAVTSMGHIDEVLIYSGRSDTDSGHVLTMDMFNEIDSALSGISEIDGLTPQVARSAPTINLRSDMSEGGMRVVGVHSDSLDGFGELKLISGAGIVDVGGLGSDEAYVNDKAIKTLDVMTGDRLEINTGASKHVITVMGVVESGGIGGYDSTIIMPLSRTQEMFREPDQGVDIDYIDAIMVSNTGDEITGTDLSDKVTGILRVHFSSREIVSDLKHLLSQQSVLDVLQNREVDSFRETQETSFDKFLKELSKPNVTDQLIMFMSDDEIVETVRDSIEDAIESEYVRDSFNSLLGGEAASNTNSIQDSSSYGGLDGLSSVLDQVDILLRDLSEFTVLDFKKDLLDAADDAGSGVTSIFLIMSLFSITVGILLIFLIFVMLAAARRSEMGMARAVGANRGHLIKMFIIEGTAYALISASVGVLIGLGVSAAISYVINLIISSITEDFVIVHHFTTRGAIIAYCLGMLITFITVGVSSYHVSRMNIVLAIRGLPESLMSASKQSFVTRILYVVKAVLHPLILLARSFRALIKLDWRLFLKNIFLSIFTLFPPIWIFMIGISLVRFARPYFQNGWLTIMAGIIVMMLVQSEQLPQRESLFGAGVSLFILGLGLVIRSLMGVANFTSDTSNRVGFTLIAIATLVYWALPPNTLPDFVGDLEGDFDVMFVSGIFMVSSAVIAVMVNSDIMLKFMTFAFSRIRQFRPVAIIAVAYPMSSKLRTGLTLAMFALVIFTLMVMSVITSSFATTFEDDFDVVLAGWDVEGSINQITPISDINKEIENSSLLNAGEFVGIGGFTRLPVEVREQAGRNSGWEQYQLRAASEEFLYSSDYELKLIAEGYGPDAWSVWRALNDDPNLAVIEGDAMPSEDGEQWRPLRFDEVFYDSESMDPVNLEIRMQPWISTEILKLKVIAVIDRKHSSFGDFDGMLVSKKTIDNVSNYPLSVDRYRFKLSDNADTEAIVKDLEVTFRDHGMQAYLLSDAFNEGLGIFKAFLNIFIGFMALGLVVGVAALGVVSTRAVVERRQQIGVLRAIGYKGFMIQLSFLIESSFIAILGTLIGLGLGLILSYSAILDIRSEQPEENIQWVVPWMQIMVIVTITYLSSLLATYLPARQASKIYPAEALRYE